MSQALNAGHDAVAHGIAVHRLLARQVAQSQVSFYLDDNQQGGNPSGPQSVPPLLIFSPSWAQPLISAYSRLLAILAFGPDSSVLFPCKFALSLTAPLGLVCHEAAIDGSAAGVLRAAIASRAAQEALGFSLSDPRPQNINFSVVIRQCATPDALAAKALRCQSPDEWMRLAYAMNLDQHHLFDNSNMDAMLQYGVN